jgi:hypothetical protein
MYEGAGAGRLMMATKANYRVEAINSKSIVLRDIGPWDKFMTITNAAEQVVVKIDTNFRLSGRRLFYYDTDGELTELLLKDDELGRKVFAGFKAAKPEEVTDVIS